MGNTLINPGYVDARKFGVGADFAVYTGPMRPMKQAELPVEDRDKPIVDMVGSSTIEDLQGDNMRVTALQDMTQVHPDLVLWLNHTYEVPDSSYGKLYSMPRMQIQQKLVDLWLASKAFLSNPPASRTYHLIKDEGARFGCSVGCIVTEMSFSNPDDPYNSIIYVDHVTVLEWSICGIPANQRCWVENAIKGLFARSLVEGDGDKAISLAPAYKGLFTRNYDEAVRNITSAGLRKQLEHTPARFTKPHQIYYDFTEGREGFALRDSQRKTTKALSRDDVTSILERGVILDDVGDEGFDADDVHTLLQKQAEARIASPQRQEAGIPDDATVVTTAIDDSVESVEKSAEPILDSDSGAALNRQDVAESSMEEEEAVDRTKKAMPSAGDVEVGEDGKHEACKGLHSHAHPAFGSQGDDSSHDHSHEHSDDASHQHSHADASKEADKSIEAGDENEAIVEIIEKQQETPDVSPLETEQVPVIVKEAQPAIVLFDELQRNALMETYKFFAQQLNTLSAQLGFPVLSVTDKGMVPTADGVNGQEVVSTVSRLDTLMDSITSQISEASYCADNLMAMLSIPDVDDGYSVYAADSAHIVTKEGRAISSQNMKHLQTIHDCVKAMHPGVCAGESAGISVEDAENEARMQGEGQPIPQAYSTLSASFDTVSNSLNDVTRGLAGIAGLNIKSIVGDAVNEAMEVSRKSLDLLQREQRVIMENMKRLKEMPLGRPTSFVGRSITPSEDTATYEDMLIAGKALSDLSESDLETVERGGMRMKRWPQGFKAGQRPALTDFQKTYMSPLDYYPYEQALKEVFVPIENSEQR